MCPISFKIYGMELNERHFSSGTVTIHICDKPYQELNFESHLNSVLLCKYGKNTVRFAHVLFHFISVYLFVLTFAIKLKNEL